jgi:cellobiose PTS system EIIC component
MSQSSAASRQSCGASNPISAVAWLEDRVAPAARRFGEAPSVRALRESLPIAFGALLVAFGFLIYYERGPLIDRATSAIGLAFAIMSVALVLILAINFAKRLRYTYAPAIASSILAFAFALPRESMRSFENFGHIVGTSGLFTAIVCCLSVAGITVLARRRWPGDAGSVIGAVAVWIGSYGLYALHLSIGAALNALIMPLGSLGDSFWALLVITAVEAALYAFGIHGPALLAAIVLPVYMSLQFANTAAAAHHQAMPHLVVVSTFMFVFPGGTGATLPAVLLLLRSRVARLRRIAYATLLPSLCNINEPVLFGLPLVYNPYLMIPFVVAPIVLCVTTYFALAFGFVNAPVVYLPSTLPVFFNVFAATFDWRSVALLAFNIVLSGLIYYPFVRLYESSEAALAASPDPSEIVAPPHAPETPQ